MNQSQSLKMEIVFVGLLTSPMALSQVPLLRSHHMQSNSETGHIRPLGDLGLQKGLFLMAGDANLDGHVTLLDVSVAVEHISGGSHLVGDAFLNADINADNRIDIRDLVGIVNAIQAIHIYYLSSSLGDDSQDGLSPVTAWKTLDRITLQVLIPGDQVLLKCGDTWRETLYAHGRGTADAWITFGSYDSGTKPRILGSEQAVGWVELGPDIWRSDTPLTNPYQGGYSYAEVFFEELDGSVSWGRHVDYDPTFSSLQEEYDWTWNGDRIFIFSPDDPALRYGAVEAPQRNSCIRFPDINGVTVLDNDYVTYLCFTDLEIMYAMRHGIYPGYNEIEAYGLKVSQCHIGCIGVKGGASAYGIAAWHSDMLIQDNVIHDCGRRGISLNTYTGYTPGLTISNVVIDHNHFYNGFHTTGPDISSLPGSGHTLHHITISNNILDDRGIQQIEETSNVIYVNGESGNNYHDFFLFNNVIMGATSRAVLLRSLSEVFVYHNTVYANHPDADPYSLVTFHDVQNIDFRNNIIHGTLINPLHLSRCVLDEGASSFLERDYNLYFQDNPDQPFTGSENGFGGWDTFMSEWSVWTIGSGFDLNSPEPQPPLFIDSTSGDLHLQGSSAAKQSGFPLLEVTHDREGNLRNAEHPSLGAYE